MSYLPFVSVVIPCRNEERFIGRCLESILANDYPRERMEILVVDGMSTDRTRAIVQRYAQLYSCIKLLENPERITPTALNIGIRHARGEVILRMDAHATYDPHYVSTLVKALDEYNADNTGGITIGVPSVPSKMGEAISATFGHWLGAGNARYRRYTSVPTWVDTVFGGCYRRTVFERVGLFNEALVRNQDIEFNSRLRRAGGRILLVPDAIARYYVRSDLWSFTKQNWKNGMWVLLSLAYAKGMPFGWRHIVPLGFVIATVVLAGTALILPAWRWALAAVIGAYIITAVVVSAQVAARTRDPWKALLMPLAFAALHFPYGLGSLWGGLKAIWLIGSRALGKGVSEQRGEATL